MTAYLTNQPIDTAALLAEVGSAGHGANLLFLGTVRSSAEDGEVAHIDYSAYPGMAEAEFDRIVGEARDRWPLARVAIRHRTGPIATGEASVGIAVGAPHRDEAYACSRYVIEETKKRVPIWKKEQLASGTARWVEPAVHQ